jgi:Ala-tRNA(Pro) deacylase
VQWISAAFGTALAPSTATFLASKGELVRTFLNMGLIYCSAITEACAVGQADTALSGIIRDIENAASKGEFLSGSREPGPLDVLAAGAFAEPLTLLAPPASAAGTSPGYGTWANAVFSLDALAVPLAACGLQTGGRTREGGQVDLRPKAERVSVDADMSIARNAGHKKAASQRDAEDAANAAKATPTAASTAPPPSASAAPSDSSALPSTPRVQPASNKELPALFGDARTARTLSALSDLGVAHGAVHAHAPAMTAADLAAALSGVTGARIKNLFLRAKKERAPGDSRLWLVVALADAKTDLNAIGKKLGYAKDGVRFADAETLAENLGVAQGHVSPLALVNDEARLVNVVLDAALATAPGPLLFHPCFNEASVEINYADLLKLIDATGHAAPVVMDFTA